MRSPARRHPPRPKWGWGTGRWANFGPMATSGISGVRFPKRLMVRQRGVLVLRGYHLGEQDRPDSF